jgi:hypothetical protein
VCPAVEHLRQGVWERDSETWGCRALQVNTIDILPELSTPPPHHPSPLSRKETIKSFRVSPDAFVQQALQGTCASAEASLFSARGGGGALRVGCLSENPLSSFGWCVCLQ